MFPLKQISHRNKLVSREDEYNVLYVDDFWPFIAAPKCKLDFDLDYVKTFKGRSQVIQLVLQESVGKQKNFSLCLPGNFNYIKLLLKRIDL